MPSFSSDSKARISLFFGSGAFAGIFDELGHLQMLNLRKNRISHLSERLFFKLPKLLILQLTGNQIRQVTGNFFPLRLVQKLLFQIHPQDFLQLSNLQELHLGRNLIGSVPKNAFLQNRRLDKLFLLSNNLEELHEEAFQGLGNLTCLFIQNNILREIGDRIFLPTPKLLKL